MNRELIMVVSIVKKKVFVKGVIFIVYIFNGMV